MLKCGVHMLEVERGRYFGIQRFLRLCKLCGENEVEDEMHFIFKCPVYDDLRYTYIPVKYKTYINPNRLILLLASRNETVIKNVASYMYYASQRRQHILDASA